MQKLFLVLTVISIFVQFSYTQIIPTSRQGSWTKAGYDSTQRAIPRSFNKSINVLLHGLKNDGSTDNSSALSTLISSTIQSGSSTVLYFPQGIYIFRSNIVINNSFYGIVLRGAGSENTTFHFICSSSSAFGSFIAISYSHNVGIENLTIERENTPSDLANADNINFLNCNGCWAYGIDSKKCVHFHVNISGSHNIVIKGCSQYDAELTGEGGQGYGVNIAGGSFHLVPKLRLGTEGIEALLQNA